MATVAGDEITETIMKAYLVDFDTAENMKAQAELGKEVAFTDILGFERTVSHDEILECIRGTSELLSREIAQKVLEINGGPPSALFLAGGGSKLTGLKDKVTEALKMDANRVAIAGNNFKIHAWSDEYELNNPEYATPLGIVISSGLNMINDSCRVILNERPAKLFRSGSFTALNLLMMNGFNYQDILGRSGRNLIVTVNGRRKVFYGTAPQPAALFINRKEGKLSEIIHAGDTIDFIPAISGESASACLGDIEGAAECLDITLNGAHASLKTPLKNGDVIFVKMPQPPKGKKEPEEKPEENREPEKKPEESREPEKGPAGKAEPENAQGPGNPGVPGRAAEPEAAAESAAGPGGPAERTAAEPAESVEEPTSEPAETVEKPMSEPAARPSLAASASVPVPSAPTPSAPASVPVPSAAASVPAQAPAASGPAPSPASQITFYLNGSPIRLPRKANGDPYYLMDMIQYSGIDLKNPKGRVNLSVNGAPGIFQQTLRAGDHVVIEEEV